MAKESGGKRANRSGNRLETFVAQALAGKGSFVYRSLNEHEGRTMSDCEHEPLCMTREQTDAMRLDLSNTQCENFHLRAQVTRLRDVASGILNDTVLERQDAEYYKRTMAVWFGWLRTAITSLPEQSARDAKVLRAAEKACLAKMLYDSGKASDENTLAYVDMCVNELCQAVRGDKKVNTSE